MRIVAGKFKGRNIVVPKQPYLRPSKDIVRQAVFNILSAKTENAVCLDLFCGSGALGLEAFSRGARKVVFVDSEKECLKAVALNLEKLGFVKASLRGPLSRTYILGFEARKIGKKIKEKTEEETKEEIKKEKGKKAAEEEGTVEEAKQEAELVNADVLLIVKLFFRQQSRFDLIFADPPYYKESKDNRFSQKCLDELSKYNILTESGTLVLEHYLKDKLIVPEKLALCQERKYGDTKVSFFIKTD